MAPSEGAWVANLRDSLVRSVSSAVLAAALVVSPCNLALADASAPTVQSLVSCLVESYRLNRCNRWYQNRRVHSPLQYDGANVLSADKQSALEQKLTAFNR